MSDLAAEAQTPYLERKTGVQFPILTVKGDLAALGTLIKAERFKAADTLYQQRRFNEIDYARSLLDIESQPVTLPEIMRWVQSPQGAWATLEKSLEKGGVKGAKAQDVLTALDSNEIIYLALIVARGVERPKPEAVEKNPLSSGSDAAESPPQGVGATKKRKPRTGASSSGASPTGSPR